MAYDLEEYEPGFENPPILEQLGKVIDSESAREVAGKKFKPMNFVITDSGDLFNISAEKASIIKNTILAYPTQVRGDMLKILQTSEGLKLFLKYSKERITESTLLTIYQQAEMLE